MDLLFKRYASPFSFVDGMIETGRFLEFVVEFIKTVNLENEEKHSWEFYIHKVFDMSYQEFKESIRIDNMNQNMSKNDIEATVQQTIDMVNEFNSKSKGGDG